MRHYMYVHVTPFLLSYSVRFTTSMSVFSAIECLHKWIMLSRLASQLNCMISVTRQSITSNEKWTMEKWAEHLFSQSEDATQNHKHSKIAHKTLQLRVKIMTVTLISYYSSGKGELQYKIWCLSNVKMTLKRLRVWGRLLQFDTKMVIAACGSHDGP